MSNGRGGSTLIVDSFKCCTENRTRPLLQQMWDDGVTLVVREYQAQGPECATCPANWEERRAAYLRDHHPELAQRYGERLARIYKEITPAVAGLTGELRELG